MSGVSKAHPIVIRSCSWYSKGCCAFLLPFYCTLFPSAKSFEPYLRTPRHAQFFCRALAHQCYNSSCCICTKIVAAGVSVFLCWYPTFSSRVWYWNIFLCQVEIVLSRFRLENERTLLYLGY